MSSAETASVTGPRLKTMKTRMAFRANASSPAGGTARNSAVSGLLLPFPRGSISLLLVHYVHQRPAVYEALDILLDRPHHAGAVLIRTPGDVWRDHHVRKFP